MSEKLEAEEKREAPADALVPGTKLLRDQYTIARFLNAGGFGITYLAKDSLDRTVVLKECFPATMCCRSKENVRARSRANQAEFQTIVSLFGYEARRLSKLSHPHIVGIHQVFEDNGTAYMALDYIDGYDLLDTIERRADKLTPHDIKDILTKVLSAVDYIHGYDILHRDISPDNILLDDNKQPSLIDFGAAREEATRASRILSKLHVVKDGYSPQEFYLAGSAQDKSSDLYALGATFYHVITGKAPPNAQRRVAAIASNKEDPYVPLSSRNIPGYDEFFLSAIDIAMNVFPQDRLQTAAEWMERIDTIQRQRKKLDAAQKDEKLLASIGALVAETNQAVESDKKSPKKDSEHDYVAKRIAEGKGRKSPVVSAAEQKRRDQQKQTSFLGRVFGWGKSRDVDDDALIAKLNSEAEQ